MSDYEVEAARYGNLCRVAIRFYLATGNETEALYAYLNARWAARLALAELKRVDYKNNHSSFQRS